MKKLIITIVIVLISISSAFAQLMNIQLTDKSKSEFLSRLSLEAGVSLSYPIQNLAGVDTYTKYKFTGSIYAKLINNVSLYINYNYFGIEQKDNIVIYYIPRDKLYSFNVGINYSYEIKNHIPFIEGGIGLFSFTIWEPNPPITFNEVTKTQFGANLGAGYRYLFDRRLGLFIKGKFHTFSFSSKNWSFWNLSGGLYLRF
ncbi:MAG: hypothetical protein WCK13_01005 [Ignavibacteriota bacterium]|nr:hypothetical protein [Ignavibacteriota bacterium]